MRKGYMRGTELVRCEDKAIQARLRWFEHVQREDSENLGRRMLRLELADRRPAGKPKRTPAATLVLKHVHLVQ